MTLPTKTYKPIHIGAVEYLNTKPLVYQLGEFAPDAQLSFSRPSSLADGLADGQYDVALIPSIEYFRRADYEIVSDACIACRGPVLSVRLLSRRPMHAIQTLALDQGSRTSVVLAQILLRERFGLTPRLVPLADAVSLSACPADAILVIGDRAMHSPPDDFVECWDLGDEWCRWSGLPFVFAMWVARHGSDARRLAAALQRARDAGVREAESIARVEAGRVGLSVDRTLTYLRENLYFYLGPREQQGLQRYREYAERHGLLASTEQTVDTSFSR